MGRRSGRAASEEEIKREKAVKTSVFADVNKQINYMKTDHIRSMCALDCTALHLNIGFGGMGAGEVLPSEVKFSPWLKEFAYAFSSCCRCSTTLKNDNKQRTHV